MKYIMSMIKNFFRGCRYFCLGIIEGRFYKLINSSGSRSARLNLSESVAHPRTSAINSVRLSTHCDVVFDDLTCMDTTIPCW